MLQKNVRRTPTGPSNRCSTHISTSTSELRRASPAQWQISHSSKIAVFHYFANAMRQIESIWSAACLLQRLD
jgi:hypothetical protein